MKTAKIYVLTDPRESSVIKCYVGKSIEPKRRFKNHLIAKGDTKRDRWIKSLQRQNLLPLLLILEECASEHRKDWEQPERNWISKYRADARYDVLNHTGGGEGISDIDDETRGRMSEAAKKRYINHRAIYDASYASEERNSKISASLTGKKHEWNKDLPQNQPGWKHTKEAKIAISLAATANNLARAAAGRYKKTAKPKIKSSRDLTAPRDDLWKQHQSEAATLRWQRYRQRKENEQRVHQSCEVDLG
jgi:hypothetical protein